MTLIRVKRSQLLEIALLTLATLLFICGQALALTIISPTEGAKVKEKVKIVIPRSAVPTDGFVTISVDGKFRAAAAMPEEVADDKPSVPKSPYYTYLWDTKAPVQNFSSSAEPVNLKDGKHQVEVQVHDSIGRKIETASVDVTVQNKPATPNPMAPLKLYYRYRLGDQAVYHCRADAEIVDNLGQPLLSGVSAVKADFDIIQSVEEARRDGSALVRYKINKDASVLVYGQQVQLPEAATGSPSLYKLIDSHGKVLQSNIVRKTATTVTDVLPLLPRKPVQIGDTWPSEFKIKIEGINDVVPFQMTNTLDSIEWEGGRECAKIESSMTALSKMRIIPGSQAANDDQTPVKGTGTFFFSYKTGKLIKASALLETTMSLDQATLTSLQQGTIGGGQGGTPYMASDLYPSEDLSQTNENPATGRQRPKMKPRTPTVPVYGPSGSTNLQPTAEKTTVRVRLNWSLEIQK